LNALLLSCLHGTWYESNEPDSHKGTTNTIRRGFMITLISIVYGKGIASCFTSQSE
jgi:hypothetical protein